MIPPGLASTTAVKPASEVLGERLAEPGPPSLAQPHCCQAAGRHWGGFFRDKKSSGELCILLDKQLCSGITHQLLQGAVRR